MQSAAAPNRLFFALWPGPIQRTRIAAAAATLSAQHALDGYASNPERYHLTLYFLGDFVAPEHEAVALKAAQQIEAPPFTLHLDQAGSFRNRDIVTWLGAKESPPELEHLQQALTRALASLPRERQPGFVPHLTVRRGTRQAIPQEPIAPIHWKVDEFVLVRSLQQRRPIQYQILQRCPLRGPPLPPLEQYRLL